MALAPWVPADQLNWRALSTNSAAIALIEAELARGEPNRVDFIELSFNLGAIHIIEQNLDRISFRNLCMNPSAMHILRRFPEKISWPEISYNRAAADIIENEIAQAQAAGRQSRIDWSSVSMNFDENFLRRHFDNIVWGAIGSNHRAIGIILENLDRINFDQLNRNRAAVDLLLSRPDSIDWEQFLENKSGADHIRANIDNIEWSDINLMNISDNENCEDIICELSNKGVMPFEYLPATNAFIDIIKSRIDDYDMTILSYSSIIFE